jgi:hypothetical protein
MSFELRALSYKLRVKSCESQATAGRKRRAGKQSALSQVFIIPTPNAAEESATPQNLFGELGSVP